MTDYIAAYRDPSNPYHREATNNARLLRAGQATIDQNGVMRWASNGRVPFNDMCELAYHVGLPVDLKACDIARKLDNEALVAEIRKNDQPMTREELAEARAAHGPGVKLVNVITGRTTIT